MRDENNVYAKTHLACRLVRILHLKSCWHKWRYLHFREKNWLQLRASACVGCTRKASHSQSRRLRMGELDMEVKSGELNFVPGTEWWWWLGEREPEQRRTRYMSLRLQCNLRTAAHLLVARTTNEREQKRADRGALVAALQPGLANVVYSTE